ncbi:MAG: hypothetical protein JOZ45_11545 [Acidobacteriaceae bacterium]|nr:hypothetical protein [Acidobacteriaceae bacterium]
MRETTRRVKALLYERFTVAANRQTAVLGGEVKGKNRHGAIRQGTRR